MGIFDFFKYKSSTKGTNYNLSFEQKYKIALETDKLNNLGVTEYRNGNIRGAIEYYEKALEIMPENDDSLINLAMCYIKLGDFDKAIVLCEKAIKIDPQRAIGYRTIGDVYYHKSNWDEVVKWYRKSTLRGDQSTKSWLVKNGYSLTDEIEIETLFNNNNEFVFYSTRHQRYQNNEPVMGLQVGHQRNIKIEKNISGGKGYSVTIINPNSNPLTGNITMSTKPMELINKNQDEFELRGYGIDRLSGSSFSDYGLTIYLKNGVAEKVVLHMFDRNVDIEYMG